jgi:tetratricopeptide (TPR) repeat protein
MLPTEPEICIKVFICYSHDDQELRNRLEQHLSALIYSGKITIWQDQKILPGANWEDQINAHLGEADLILLLISASFISSQYCWNKELRTALQRHKDGSARIIPIILKPVDFQDTPLGQLQALPTGIKPITRWSNQDEAFEDVVRGIRTTIEDLRATPREQQRKREQSKQQWLSAGEEHWNAGCHTEAIAAYEQAIRLDPNFVLAYNGKGAALSCLGRHEEAISAYEQAIRLDPNFAISYHNKGTSLYILERYEEALSAHEQAIRLDPKDIYYYGKSSTLEKLGRRTEAKLVDWKVIISKIWG